MDTRLLVSGVVQGVGFRPFVYRLAKSLNLKGFIKNLGDAGVEIYLKGSEKEINNFIMQMRKNKPILAVIENIEIKKLSTKVELNDFKIIESSKNRTNKTSIIPPDIAICNNCINELFDENDRRFGYFFITCTDCGPRFSTITDLPYDRPNTTLNEFPMCKKCSLEYKEPVDRRFHAQTIACNECGPKIYLTDKYGKLIEEKDPILYSTKLLEEGNIIAIKGNSGFHFATSTTNSKPILKLRTRKDRPTKPFAIMAPNIETIENFAEVTNYEKEILSSYIRPIVLLNKNENYFLSEEVAPGLHNVGVMLPFTGLHYLLFRNTKEPAFVMTSANPQDEPIAIENEKAIKKLGKFVDYFLLHDRTINQRSDDSVLRFHSNNPLLIRRSRGFVPSPIELEWLKESPISILGCGAEENVTFCILKSKKAFLSQYIGKTQKYETFNFFKDSLNYFKKILNINFQSISCDFHKGFNTSIYAERESKENNIPLIRVPHHYAHLAGLMGENNLSEIIGIIVDGFGLGEDGKPWGGEITAFKSKKFVRLSSIEEFDIPGGDLATMFPLRIAMGFLKNTKGYNQWIEKLQDKFPYGLNEIKIVDKQINENRVLRTSSAGRFLDSISAILGICYKRTYDGEPAIKLESAAHNGKDILNIDPIFKNNKLIVSEIAEEIFLKKGKYDIKDLAYSAISYLSKGLTDLAIRAANELNLNKIGISGGVAFNELFVNISKDKMKKEGFNLIEHKLTPPGDGGISFGQVIADIILNYQDLLG